MNTKLFYFFFAIAIGIVACNPYIEDDIELPGLPGEPEFTYTWLDSNTIVVEDLSSAGYARVWEFGASAEGNFPNPRKSTEQMDTVILPKIGVYPVILHIASSDGGGTASSTKVIEIFKDAVVGCTPSIEFLVGGCEETSSKCWTFSSAEGAIAIGPIPGSTEWYSSPENGLVPEQTDDRYCFDFQSNFVYDNNGQTINPWNGYEAENFTPPPGTWELSLGTGDDQEDQIILPAGQFLGVRDCGPIYDIKVLTATDLVVESPLINEAGVIQEGWFTLKFVKAP